MEVSCMICMEDNKSNRGGPIKRASAGSEVGMGVPIAIGVDPHGELLGQSLKESSAGRSQFGPHLNVLQAVQLPILKGQRFLPF